MKKIAVIYTGGTIGMQNSPQGLVPCAESLRAPLQKIARPEWAVSLIALTPLIDSSNAGPAQWAQICSTLQAQETLFDGFVVIHGTDTLAYTAAALAFLLPNFSRPVILTGAMRPISAEESDGWHNLQDALSAASQPNWPMCVVFARRAWQATRVRKNDSCADDAFATPNQAPLYDFSSGAPYPDFMAETNQSPQAIELRTDLRVPVLWIAPGAGVDVLADALQPSTCDGAILLTYGAGNAPDHPALLQAVAQMSAANRPVINVAQVWNSTVNMGTYAAGAGLAQAGAISAGNMTLEAAFVKLICVLSMNHDAIEAIKTAFSCEWAGEFV